MTKPRPVALGLRAHGAEPRPWTVVGRSFDTPGTALTAPAEFGNRNGPLGTGTGVPVPVPAEDGWSAVRSAFERDPRRDVLFVAQGVEPPPLLGLRLHWSAWSHPKVGIVSPLSECDPVSSLSRHGIDTTDAVAIDRWIAGQANAPAVDAPRFGYDCFYLRADAAHRALEAGPINSLNDLLLALQRQGFITAIAPHVFVGRHRDSIVLPRGEDLNVATFLAETPLHSVARRIPEAKSTAAPVPVERRVRSRILHISHSLGGGLERWITLFAGASDQQENFVLKSIGEQGRFGCQLWLFDARDQFSPIRTWKLRKPIASTVTSHLRYSEILHEVVEELGVETVVVSSLIGHSLDALRTGLTTAHIWHDYYPFCSAVHIYFDGICRRCTADDVALCREKNPLNRLFPGEPPQHWTSLRKAFQDTLCEYGVVQVAPSASVVRHLAALAPQHDVGSIRVIPHGTDPRDTWPTDLTGGADHRPLRLLVPGRLTREKGIGLLPEIIRGTAGAVEFVLLGCGAGGHEFSGRGVTVIPDYDRPEMADLVRTIAPDAALLLSVVPETFSFVLDEMIAAAIPPIAVRSGSFVDRVIEGTTGFLCDPEVPAIVSRVLDLAAHRGALRQVHHNLLAAPTRSALDMLGDYVSLLNLPAHSRRAYFARRWQGESHQPENERADMGSPNGFAEFLVHVERGTLHHIARTHRLRPWQRHTLLAGAHLMFNTARGLMRYLR